MKIKKGSQERAFTSMELIVVLIGMATIACTITAVVTLAVGNFWYTEAGVLKKIQHRHPEATEVVESSRYIWGYSIFTVRGEGGIEKTYRLNTNCLWNYELVDGGVGYYTKSAVYTALFFCYNS